MQSNLSGKCMCGAVAWAYSGPITRSLVCHCTDCQRATSSPVTAFVGLEIAHLEWVGAPNHYESSPSTYRGFCPDCGTRLYFRSDRWPDEIHMHAMTLDDPAAHIPSAQVMVRSRMAWLDDLENLPQHDGFQQDPNPKTST